MHSSHAALKRNHLYNINTTADSSILVATETERSILTVKVISHCITELGELLFYIAVNRNDGSRETLVRTLTELQALHCYLQAAFGDRYKAQLPSSPLNQNTKSFWSGSILQLFNLDRLVEDFFPAQEISQEVWVFYWHSLSNYFCSLVAFPGVDSCAKLRVFLSSNSGDTVESDEEKRSTDCSTELAAMEDDDEVFSEFGDLYLDRDKLDSDSDDDEIDEFLGTFGPLEVFGNTVSLDSLDNEVECIFSPVVSASHPSLLSRSPVPMIDYPKCSPTSYVHVNTSKHISLH